MKTSSKKDPGKKSATNKHGNSARRAAIENDAVSRRGPAKREEHPSLLKGWKQISKYLGQPVATAQRWAKTGMPAHREGRFLVASPEELSRWLGREAGLAQPVRIPADNREDLSTDLRRALAAARHRRRS